MMGPDYGRGLGTDGMHGHGHPSAVMDPCGCQMDRERANATPNSARHNKGCAPPSRPPLSPARSAGDRGGSDTESRRSGERNESRPTANRTGSGQVRTCKKCGDTLTGQFVRALDGTFHLDCFKCRDCGQIVASKFFPADGEKGEGPYPLCETDYFRRLGLLCHQCGSALRGSYITALDRKYHVDHFTCSVCPTVFGASDSYYEHDSKVYCHYHYSTQFAQRCSGCQTAILKQFVEIFRNGQNQHWHPECYMIHKFWNVRLNPPLAARAPVPDDAAGRERVRVEEEKMEEKVYRIWSVLSTFEESSAACISDMLLHVSNAHYLDGVMVAKRFLWHVDVLFQSANRLDETMASLDVTGLAYGREAKLLCKKIVVFFSLLSKAHDGEAQKMGVTQELLTLVTGLAHYLKLLIRICLQGALRIEKELGTSEGLHQFLLDLGTLEAAKADDSSMTLLQLTTGMARLSANDSDQCVSCRKPIEDECAKTGEKRWHMACTKCSRCGRELTQDLQNARLNLYDSTIFCQQTCASCSSGNVSPFQRVSKLQQYMFLLQVALARLLEILRNHAPTRSRPDGHAGDLSRLDPQAHGDTRQAHHRESSYESTLADVRRLRSTRLDKHLSSSFRKARTSRIMGGPEGSYVRPGSSGGEHETHKKSFSIVEERGPHDEEATEMTLPNQDALTLDDIPRIVAAEQAREQRPYQAGRKELFRSSATEPHFGAGGAASGGHQRSHSDSRDVRAGGHPRTPGSGRKYLSELSGLEHFIVRHLAVLTMHPMVESDFTLEELLGLIEVRKGPSFWKNIGKAFKNDKQKSVKKKGIFGVPLEMTVERDGADSTDGVGPFALRIPVLIDDIISVMRKMDLSVEGVFRKNGHIKKLTDLCEKIDREGSNEQDLSSINVIQVAALLKRYLRQLPDPLMTHKLYRLWIAAARIPDENKKRHCLHLACCLLPKCHRDCLEILFCFLKWVGSFHQVDEEAGSRMDIKNLATVIAPNVLYNNAKQLSLDSDPMYAIEAVEILIMHVEEMCLVPDDLVDVLSDPTLFSTNVDLTTKELLKRFGDRGTNGLARPYGADMNDMATGGGRYENPARPPPRRVDTDPNLWNHESSVRPMLHEASARPPFAQGAGGSRRTPPSKRQDNGRSSPYGTQGQFESSVGSSDGERGGSAGQVRREWRNSNGAWGQNPSSVTTGPA